MTAPAPSLVRGVIFCSAVMAGALLSGCAEPEERRATVRLIQQTSPDEVLSEAIVILRREFGRVDADRTRGVVRSVAAEYRTASDSGTARDLVGGASTMRRSAELSVASRGRNTIVRLRIDVERQESAEREPIRTEEKRWSDSPAYTPIERDAATTPQQNTFWRRLRRDYALERSLLEELQERFAVEPPATEQAPVSPPSTSDTP